MPIVPFRRFKVPGQVETQFFSVVDDGRNKQFAEEDLARSGLTMDDLEAYTSPLVRLKEGATAGYVIPYYDLKGNPLTDEDQNLVMFRTRMQYPEFSREQRYSQPSGEQLAKYGLPPYVPYIPPATLKLGGTELICAEGEKKAASIVKLLQLPTFGIGGCQLWRNPDGSGTIHPWIRDLIAARGATTVTIVPDGDVRRYDICTAYGNFARSLENEGVAVKILDPQGKIDDLLVEWGSSRNDRWGGIQSIALNDLVQSPSALIKKYGLAFKTDAKGTPIVHQHTSNIMRLMEEHDAFPRIWRNTDNNRIMVGEEIAQADLTEIDIANYFQHNLGFDKVNNRTIYTCIQALGKRHARSPFLEYVRSTQWDGVPRVETWLQNLWGLGDSPFVREVGTKWLVSACARMDKPGTKIDWMLIVVGPQKTGKTSMPGIMFKGCNLVLYGEQNDKDLHMLLHSSLCVGFDELDSFSRRESSNLKAMVTRNEDAFRPPYGASVEVFPRRFTLYGSGNRHDFLQHDPSGYRRYAVLEVSRLLDFAGLEACRDQLWAEAWGIYSAGGSRFWEVDNASEEAEKFVIANPFEDKILEFLARKETEKVGGPRKDSLVYFKIGELMIHMDMEGESGNSMRVKDIAAILASKGVMKPTKSSRHPDTGAIAKWYTWDPALHPLYNNV